MSRVVGLPPCGVLRVRDTGSTANESELVAPRGLTANGRPLRSRSGYGPLRQAAAITCYNKSPQGGMPHAIEFVAFSDQNRRLAAL